MDKDYVPNESSDEEDYIIDEVELKKHGAMFQFGHVIPFLFEYSDEESLDETTQTFLKQVRDSGGYEVECSPKSSYYDSPFIPRNPDYDDGKRLAEEAIKSINRQVEEEGERYELIKLERYVYVLGMPKLLTLLVKDCNGSEKRLRACMMWLCQPEFFCYLHEWKDVTEGVEDKGWRVVEKEDKEWRAKSEKEEEVKDSSIAVNKDGDVRIEVEKGSIEEDQTFDMPEEVKDSSIGVDKGLKDGDVGMEVEKGSIEEDQTYDTELEVKRLIEEPKRLREELESIEKMEDSEVK